MRLLCQPLGGKRDLQVLRNSIGVDFLNALLNDPMNGLQEMTDKDAIAVALEWKPKQRRASSRTKPDSGANDFESCFAEFESIGCC